MKFGRAGLSRAKYVITN